MRRPAAILLFTLGACSSDLGRPPVNDAPPATADAPVAGEPDAMPTAPVDAAARHCEAVASGAHLLGVAGDEIATYDSLAVCEEVLAAAGEGVVCVYFTPDMPIGPGGWNEEGWRAMNVDTRIGLGRRPHLSYEDCLDATRNARGGVVCTNTGVGYKSAHIVTNMWCGASSNLPHCLEASEAARNFYVCSFPSDGDGSEPGWVLTQIDSECHYLTDQMPLADCNEMVP